jgi:hypothetical protein
MIRLGNCLLLAALAAACQSSSAPSGPPAITGAVVARDLRISIGEPPTIHVKETPDAECGVIFLLSRSTRVYRRAPDGTVAAVSLSDLTVGRRVSVWADVVLRSCPGQASAAAVEILDSE